MASRASPFLTALLVALVASSAFAITLSPDATGAPLTPGIAAAPAILSTEPAAGATVNTKTPRITVTYERGNVTAVSLLLDGLNVTSGGTFNETTFVWAYPFELAEGVHAADFTLWDNTSASSSRTWTFTIDAIAPQITLTSPTSLLTNRSSITVSGFVSESVAALFVNGQPVPTPLPAPGFAFYLTLPVPEGFFPIQVVAVDFAGNVGTLLSAVQVDTTPPIVAVNNPPMGTQTDQLSVEVRGTVDDPSALVIVNGLQVRPDANGAWRTIVALAGSHRPILTTITVYAVDPAGNRGNVVTRDVTYTSPVPNLQEGLTSDNQEVASLRALVTYGLIAVLAVLLAVQSALYVRLRNKIREPKAPAPKEPPESKAETKDEKMDEPRDEDKESV